MGNKTAIVSTWAVGLIILNGFAQHDWQAIWAMINGQGTTPSNTFFFRVGSEIALGVILFLVAESGEDGANLSLWFLAGLTLVFCVTQQSWLNTLLTTGSVNGGYSEAGPGGGKK